MRADGKSLYACCCPSKGCGRSPQVFTSWGQRVNTEGAWKKSQDVVLSFRYEANVSAKEAQAGADTRFFAPRAYDYRTQNVATPPPKGARAPFRVMSRLNRVTRADFVHMERGTRAHGTLFSATIAPMSPPRVSAATCVVSKKVAMRATERNRIKRRCREALRRHVNEFPKQTILVLYAKKAAVEAPFADVERDIRSLIEKIARIGYNARQ